MLFCHLLGMRTMKTNNVYHGDCLELLPSIPDKSVDMILCDLPYGTTQCEWDSIIDMAKLWAQYERVIKDNGNIILTSQGMFTADLMTFKRTWFNHDYVWIKNAHSNFALTGIQPHRYFENVLVFRPPRKADIDRAFNLELRAYFTKVNSFIGLNNSQIDNVLGHRGYCHSYGVKASQFALCTKETYDQLIEHFKIDEMEGFLSYDTLVSMKENLTYLPYTYNHGATVKKQWIPTKSDFTRASHLGNFPDREHIKREYENYPKNVLYFDCERGLHPTQKPVSLFEYLIKTYSNENEVVLDNCSGSGTTAIACLNSNRQYICIEKDETYYKRSLERIANHEPLLHLASSNNEN
nr:MAG TPA: adenine-specific methyltransferase [Caudoviricetes sp.]